MALNRKSSSRFQANIWPGFVDAMTGLLLVLMFVLTIFTVIQFALRETITGQENKLHQLTDEVAALTEALGLERDRSSTLAGQVGSLTTSLSEAQAEADRQSALIARLTTERDQNAAALVAAQNRITGFEAQVAGLLAERSDLQDRVSGLETDNATLMSEQEALNLALAQARSEVDAAAEEARLAAARREALEALIAKLNDEAATRDQALADAQAQVTALTDAEAQYLVDAAAAEELRAKLAAAEDEITSMTLALEEQRKEAENTLTLLAAANLARDELQTLVDQNKDQLTEAERQAALLQIANQKLAEEEALSADSQRQVALLNEQVATLRTQVATLQGLIDVANESDRQSQVQIEALGSQLNTALARAASEERRRRELEEAARIAAEAEAARLAAEALDLAHYRSEFFGRMRDVLAGQEGVQIVGDRFVFSSEVLFESGSADLSDVGRAEIAKVANMLHAIEAEIPPTIDWIIRVDGHTDNVPLSPGSPFASNWELSQARALSVVEYMINDQGIPPNRLAAAGFGEFQPVDNGTSPEALAHNRRIELKLTER